MGDYLGVDHVIWLGQGHPLDRDTDGHVDAIAQYLRPGDDPPRRARRSRRPVPRRGPGQPGSAPRGPRRGRPCDRRRRVRRGNAGRHGVHEPLPGERRRHRSRGRGAERRGRPGAAEAARTPVARSSPSRARSSSRAEAGLTASRSRSRSARRSIPSDREPFRPRRFRAGARRSYRRGSWPASGDAARSSSSRSWSRSRASRRCRTAPTRGTVQLRFFDRRGHEISAQGARSRMSNGSAGWRNDALIDPTFLSDVEAHPLSHRRHRPSLVRRARSAGRVGGQLADDPGLLAADPGQRRRGVQARWGRQLHVSSGARRQAHARSGARDADRRSCGPRRSPRHTTRPRRISTPRPSLRNDRFGADTVLSRSITSPSRTICCSPTTARSSRRRRRHDTVARRHHGHDRRLHVQPGLANRLTDPIRLGAHRHGSGDELLRVRPRRAPRPPRGA